MAIASTGSLWEPYAVAIDDSGTSMVHRWDRGGRIGVTELRPVYYRGPRGTGSIEAPQRFSDPLRIPLGSVLPIEETQMRCVYLPGSPTAARRTFVACGARSNKDGTPVPNSTRARVYPKRGRSPAAPRITFLEADVGTRASISAGGFGCSVARGGDGRAVSCGLRSELSISFSERGVARVEQLRGGRRTVLFLGRGRAR